MRKVNKCKECYWDSIRCRYSYSGTDYPGGGGLEKNVRRAEIRVLIAQDVLNGGGEEKEEEKAVRIMLDEDKEGSVD